MEPLKPTFERDAIKARIDGYIDNSLEQTGEVNRDFTGKVNIHDLIYDELRNLNGALASLSAGNEILLKAIVDNTATTADRLGNVRDNTAVMSEHLESVDERLVEANNLLTDTRDNETVITQDDYDKYNEECDMSSKNALRFAKKVKLESNERHIIYQALGSRASTLRNQIGYTRVNEDGTLRNQISNCENLIRKIKNS